MALIQEVVGWFGLDPIEREYDEIAIMIGADGNERYQPPGPLVCFTAFLNVAFFLMIIATPILVWGMGLLGTGVALAVATGLFLVAFLTGRFLAHLVFWPSLLIGSFLVVSAIGNNLF